MHQANVDQLNEIEERFAETTALTLEGLQLKALAAARYQGELEAIASRSKPSGHETADFYSSMHRSKSIDMVTHNLVAMALGNMPAAV